VRRSRTKWTVELRCMVSQSGADESGDRLIAVRWASSSWASRRSSSVGERSPNLVYLCGSSPEFFGAAVGMSIKVGGAVGMPYSWPHAGGHEFGVFASWMTVNVRPEKSSSFSAGSNRVLSSTETPY
jgi:hypothetical protein